MNQLTKKNKKNYYQAVSGYDLTTPCVRYTFIPFV